MAYEIIPLKLGSFSSQKSTNQPVPLKFVVCHPQNQLTNQGPFFSLLKFPPDSDDVPFVTGAGVGAAQVTSFSFSRSCGEYFISPSYDCCFPKDPFVCPKSPGFPLQSYDMKMGFIPSILREIGRETWILRGCLFSW